MDFDLYKGEFLISPIPLELSLNYCSHKCAYCFANLNKPDRKADIKAIMRYFSNLHSKNDSRAQLLKLGYPILLSNRVDPFAVTNYKQSLPLIDLLTKLNIPIAFQTKGGKGVYDAIEMVKPSHWYISLSFDTDTKRKLIEPGAPSINERYKLIETLLSKGHAVSVAFNPIVEEWFTDYLGVRDIWIEHLHLNNNQEKNLSQKEIQNITPEILKKAKAKSYTLKEKIYDRNIKEYCKEKGFNIYSFDQSEPTKYWHNLQKMYKKTFPIYQDFINHLFEKDIQPNELIDFDYFYNFIENKLPNIKVHNGYLGMMAQRLYHKYKIPSQISYKMLVHLIWNNYESKQCPARLSNLAYAYDGISEYVDTNNNKLLTFSKTKLTSTHEEVR